MDQLIALVSGLDPIVAVAAPTVTWVLTNAVSFFRLKERLRPLRSTQQDPILVRMADGLDNKSAMRELYGAIDASYQLASSVIRKERRFQLVRAVQITVAIAGLLLLARSLVSTLGTNLLVLPFLGTAIGVVYLLWRQNRLGSIGAEYAVESDEGLAATRRMIESAATTAKEAIHNGKKQIKAAGPTELEFQFLEQFLVTVDALQHTESILLVQSLEAGQQSIRATYREQIAKTIGLKLDQLLRETVLESPTIDSKEFAKIAFESLERHGYTALIDFEEHHIQAIAGPGIIQSFKDEKHPKLISKNMKNFMPLRS